MIAGWTYQIISDRMTDIIDIFLAMIDLSTNPFNLNDEQIQKVTKICNDMTLDEKIGQIFCPIGNVQDEKK